MSRSRALLLAPADPRALAAAAAQKLNGAPAQEVVAWAVETFFPDIAVACSMQDGVVVDLAVRVEPRVEVCFLDTGFHFPETLATSRRLQERYRLNLVELKPPDKAAVFALDGNEACCMARKVLPLERYLAGKRAWITGLRRAQSPSRAQAQAVEWDAGRRLVKVNPLVDWTDDDVMRYVEEHDIVVNPLRRQGYDSIGCAPCTLPGTGREGRWAGTDKLECGLHPQEPPLARPPDRHHPATSRVGNGSREL
jgi:phosphoadenosine phosphosulfate reductase